MMKREMKDFLYKMAGLGTEYRIWSLQIRDQLCLEVSELDSNFFAFSPTDKIFSESIATCSGGSRISQTGCQLQRWKRKAITLTIVFLKLHA